jgi:hypothetical protein
MIDTVVIAGNMRQATAYVQDNHHRPVLFKKRGTTHLVRTRLLIADNIRDLAGHDFSRATVVLVGTWARRPDIEAILLQIRACAVLDQLLEALG